MVGNERPKLGNSFPASLPVAGKLLKFRDDASDAAGIGLWGVRQSGSQLSIASPVRVSAPSLTLSRVATAFLRTLRTCARLVLVLSVREGGGEANGKAIVLACVMNGE